MTIPLFHVDAFTDRPFAGKGASTLEQKVWEIVEKVGNASSEI